MRKDKTRYFIYGDKSVKGAEGGTCVISIPDTRKSYFVKDLHKGLGSELTKEQFERYLKNGATRIVARRQTALGAWIRRSKKRFTKTIDFIFSSSFIVSGIAFIYSAIAILLGYGGLDISSTGLSIALSLVGFFLYSIDEKIYEACAGIEGIFTDHRTFITDHLDEK